MSPATTDSPSPVPPPRAVLARLLAGSLIAKAIAVVAELGLADLLAAGDRPVVDLAAATGRRSPSLARLLRCLSDAGLFREDEPGVFGLTPVGACLRSDAPERGRPAALVHDRLYQRAFNELSYSLRTGSAAVDRAYGAPLFD